MFIVWGKRRTTRRLGYVAEFCPVCREVAACRLLRIGLTGHLYYISFTQGRLIGYLAKCCACGYEQGTDAANYTSRARSPGMPLPQLIQETFPSVHGSRAQELAREKQIRCGSLTQSERGDAIMAGMALFNSKIENLPSATTITWPAGLAMLVTVLLLIGLGTLDEKFALADRFPEVDQGNAYLGILLAGVMVTGALMIAGKATYVRRKMVPVIARCLRPLHPSRDELEACLELFRLAKMKAGSRVPLEPLLREIEKGAVLRS